MVGVDGVMEEADRKIWWPKKGRGGRDRLCTQNISDKAVMVANRQLRPTMTTSGFKDTHRLFLQAAISRRIMTEVAAQDLYSQVCQATQGMTL